MSCVFVCFLFYSPCVCVFLPASMFRLISGLQTAQYEGLIQCFAALNGNCNGNIDGDMFQSIQNDFALQLHTDSTKAVTVQEAKEDAAWPVS